MEHFDLDKALQAHEAACELGYDALLAESAAAWARSLCIKAPLRAAFSLFLKRRRVGGMPRAAVAGR